MVGSIPSDPCHQHADKSFFVDYSKAGELATVLQAQQFDYLVPSCNDYSYIACAALAEQRNFMGFDSFATAKALHSKESFRAITRSLKISSPRFYEVTKSNTDAVKRVSFPLLVKPADSFSGRGMAKVENKAALSAAIKNALLHSRSKKVICEEFVQGNLHSHSAYLKDGNIAFDFFVDEYCSVYPYQVNCSCHPSSLAEEVKNGVRMAISCLASACRLVDGLIHTQF
ncbi:ATP-grasp domain-containing protein, partial [bacterium]|nr:ATP-grasp domain-containing protein [bacterium]